MKKEYGWWMPDWDKHFGFFFSKQGSITESLPYQQKQRDYALSFVEKQQNAIDIGSNIGTWSLPLCNVFNTVYAFEPHPENRECFFKNLESVNNYTLYPYALSDIESIMPLYVHNEACGNISLDYNGIMTGPTNINERPKNTDVNKIDVEVKRLDSFDLSNIDFIKIDVQGHEFKVLKGAEQLLSHQSPVLCLELPQRNDEEKAYRTEITQWLSQFGYRMQGNVGKETVYKK